MIINMVRINSFNKFSMTGNIQPSEVKLLAAAESQRGGNIATLVMAVYVH